MLADHVRVDRARVEVEAAAEPLAEARGVEQRPRTQHPRGGQPARVDHDPREHVDRVADHDEQTTEPVELRRDRAHDLRVAAQERQAGVPGAAAPARRDDDGVRLAHVGDVARLDLHAVQEARRVREVHRLALGQPRLRVRQPQLSNQTLVQQRDRHRRSDPAHTHDPDPHARTL